MEVFIIFFAKMMDELLFSFSQILTNKNKRLYSSIVRGLNTLVFFGIVAQVIVNMTTVNLIAVVMGAILGRYLSYYMDKWFVKSSTWLIMVHYKGDKKYLQSFLDKLRDMGYDVFSFKTYHKDGESSLSVKIISRDRQSSRIIKSLAPEGVRISSIELKEYM